MEKNIAYIGLRPLCGFRHPVRLWGYILRGYWKRELET